MLHMKEHIEILNCDLYIESGQLCFFSSSQLNGFRHLYISYYIKMLLSIAFAKLPLQSCCLSTVCLQLLPACSSAFFCMGFLHFHLYCLSSTLSHEEFQLFQLRVYLQFHFYSSLPSVLFQSFLPSLHFTIKFPFRATLYTVTFVDEPIYSCLALILLLQFLFQSSFSTHSFLKFYFQSSLSIAVFFSCLDRVAFLQLSFYSCVSSLSLVVLSFYSFSFTVPFLQFPFLQFLFFICLAFLQFLLQSLFPTLSFLYFHLQSFPSDRFKYTSSFYYSFYCSLSALPFLQSPFLQFLF